MSVKKGRRVVCAPSVLRLVALIPAHDWAGLLGVALLGFIAFAFFVDFKRVRHTHGELRLKNNDL